MIEVCSSMYREIEYSDSSGTRCVLRREKTNVGLSKESGSEESDWKDSQSDLIKRNTLEGRWYLSSPSLLEVGVIHSNLGYRVILIEPKGGERGGRAHVQCWNDGRRASNRFELFKNQPS